MFGLPLDVIAAFFATSILIELTPGPNMAYLALVAATEGRSRGFAAVAGVALGLAIIGLAAALGVAALINASPALYQLMRWGGVVYLLWLAWDGWRSADADMTQTRQSQSHWMFFRRGLITNVLNPKAAVFYVAVLPTFLSPVFALTPQAVLLSVVYVTAATLIHALIVAMAGAAYAILQHPRRNRIVRRALSLALGAVAVWLAWKTRV